jgi:hypothetical protein
MAKKPRRNNFGIVEYQQITGTKQAWKITEFTVIQVGRLSVKAQQSTGATLLQWQLCDQFCR